MSLGIDFASLAYGIKKDSQIQRDIYVSGGITQQTATYVEFMIDQINKFDDEFEKTRTEILTPLGVQDGGIKSTPRPPIRLHINSFGGCAHAGLAIVNAIKSSTTPVHAYTSVGMSCGHLITVVCDKRFAYKYSRFMVHDMGYGAMGSHEEIKQSVAEAEILRDVLFEIISEHSKLSVDDLHRMAYDRKNKYMFGEEAKKLGFIDEVLEYKKPQFKIEEEASGTRYTDYKKEELQLVTYPIQTPKGTFNVNIYVPTNEQSEPKVTAVVRAQIIEFTGYDIILKKFVKEVELPKPPSAQTKEEAPNPFDIPTEKMMEGIRANNYTKEELLAYVMEGTVGRENDEVISEMISLAETEEDYLDIIEYVIDLEKKEAEERKNK